MARIKDSSVEAVKAAAEILAARRGLRARCARPAARYKGLCPFHEERTPSFTVSPARGKPSSASAAARAATRSRFVEKTGERSTSSARSSGSPSGSASRSSTRRSRRRPTARGGGSERLGQLLERATAFYERVLWESDAGRVRARVPRVARARRGGVPPVPARLRAGRADARRAARAQEGFTQDELLAAGLVNRRGNDYFTRRLSSRSPTRAAACAASRRASCTRTTRCRRSTSTRRRASSSRRATCSTGSHRARQAIAKQDRAVVVEGNTDVLALRQAGFEPVVASMGTALTERQLRELNRLTKRLFLCFDADAAGQEATLRGMELAVAQGFDVQVVTLPKGTDPADDPAAFEERLRDPVSYPVHRVRLEHRARTRQERGVRARSQEFLDVAPGLARAPGRARLAADLLDLPPETQAALAPPRGARARRRSSRRGCSTRATGSSAAHSPASRRTRSCNRFSRSSAPEHFDDELHRRARAHLLGEEPADGELTPLLAELYALSRHERSTRRRRSRSCCAARAAAPAQLSDARGRSLPRAPAATRRVRDGDPRVRLSAATMAPADPR